jgi:hypothetical protein
MNSDDLAILDAMPFLFWAKDRGGVYIWGNREINALAGTSVVGRRDADLPWAHNAEALVADDEQVWKTGKPLYSLEKAEDSTRGDVTLSACKFAGELDGTPCTFGVSFVIR